MAGKATIKTYFETGDKPTQAQFYELFDLLAYQLTVTFKQSSVVNGVLSVNTGLTGVSKVIAAAFYEEESFGVQGWWTMVPCRKNASNDNFEANIGSSLATGTYQIVFLYI